MKKKAIVLLSGGLDSTVNLFLAAKDFDVLLVLTFDYGQKSFLKELQSSKHFCEVLKINHKVIRLDWLKELSTTSSLTSTNAIPLGTNVDISSVLKSKETAKSVWVPNRNGLFLNIAAVFADQLGADYIIPGFNKEEAETFPDNSKDYLESASKSFSYSTRNQAEVMCYTVDMMKTEIFKTALELKIDIGKMWPCYLDQDQICGQCESCLRFLRAQDEAYVKN